jgi:hypothetical protein
MMAVRVYFNFLQAEMWIIHTLASGHCEPRIERLIVRGAAKVVKQSLDCFLRKGVFPPVVTASRMQDASCGRCIAAVMQLIVSSACCLLLNSEQNAEVCDPALAGQATTAAA